MRAATYNKVLPQLAKLTDAMAEMGKAQGVSAAQIALAWAIHKGALPLVGATKVHYVIDAVKAMQVVLTDEQVAQLEQFAKDTGVDTRGGWEGEASSLNLPNTCAIGDIGKSSTQIQVFVPRALWRI